MKFKYIFFTLALSSIYSISTFSASYSQVTWNTFDEERGLFSIQIPSNWNVTEISNTEALAPIDYMFQYNSHGNSFAWIELMISESLYTNSRVAIDSYVRDYQQFDDFKQLLPVECNKKTSDNSTACFLLSSQQLEGELKRNVLNMVSISPAGVQTDIVFITSSNIFDQLLPVGEFIIRSLDMNSTKISQILQYEATKNLKVEIPTIPSSNAIGLPAPSQFESPTNKTSNTTSSEQQGIFRADINAFVNTMPQGFGIYDKKTSNVFAPGEDILLYIEPGGFSYGTLYDNKNNTLYSVNFAADFAISDLNGNVLTEQKGIPVSDIISHHQNKEIFIPFTITQTSPFPPGNYVISYTIHDENSGKSFNIDKQIVVTESQTA